MYLFAVAWQHLALSWQLVAFFGHPFHRFSYRLVHWNGIRPLLFHHAFACMPVCRQAGTRAGGLAGRLARMPARKQACRPFRLQRKETFSKVVSFCRCVAAFGVVVAACGVLYPALSPFSLRFDRYPLLNIHTIPMPVCPCAGRQAQGQADWQAGEQAGGQECLPPGKKECLPVRGSIGYKQVEPFSLVGNAASWTS